MNIQRFKKWYYIVPAVLVLAPIVIALFVTVVGGIVMLLWNWLLPTLFGWPRITLLQGFGLVALTRILFGGFGGGGGGRGDRFDKHMTPEDKERFRRRMNERFCSTPAEGQESATTDTRAAPRKE